MKIDLQNRRMFLQGAGGAMVATPFLTSLLPKEAQAQVASGLDFVVMIAHPYGSFDTEYFPQCEGIDPEIPANTQNVRMWNTKDVLHTSPIFANSSFKDIAHKMSIYRGLDRLGWAVHHPAECLTGSKQANQGVLAQSIDQIIANQIYSTEPFIRSLNLGPNAEGPISYYLNKEGYRQPTVCHENAVSAIDFLFSNIGATSAQSEALRSGNISIVSSVMEDYKRLLNNPRLGREDKRRLTMHLELISDLEKKISNRVMPMCGKPSIADIGNVNYRNASMQEYLRSQLNVAKVALECNMTRVITVAIKGNLLHGPSHGNKGMFSEESKRKWHRSLLIPIMNEIADFCKDLDGAGLLDRGLVMTTTNMGSNTNHKAYSYPILAAGGGNVINSGKYIDYRNHQAERAIINGADRGLPGQPYNRFLTSVMQAMGLNYRHWEDPSVGQGFGPETYNGWRPHWEEFLRTYDRRKPLPKFFG